MSSTEKLDEMAREALGPHQCRVPQPSHEHDDGGCWACSLQRRIQSALERATASLRDELMDELHEHAETLWVLDKTRSKAYERIMEEREKVRRTEESSAALSLDSAQKIMEIASLLAELETVQCSALFDEAVRYKAERGEARAEVERLKQQDEEHRDYIQQVNLRHLTDVRAKVAAEARADREQQRADGLKQALRRLLIGAKAAAGQGEGSEWITRKMIADASAALAERVSPEPPPMYVCNKCGYAGATSGHDGCNYLAAWAPPVAKEPEE